MIRFREAGLNFQDVAQQSVTLGELISSDPKKFRGGRLRQPRDLQFLASLNEPPVLMADINNYEGFSLFKFQQSLILGLTHLLKLAAFSSPIEYVPIHLDADAAQIPRQRIAQVGCRQSCQGKTHLRNTLRVLNAAIQLRLPDFQLGKSDLRARLNSPGSGLR